MKYFLILMLLVVPCFGQSFTFMQDVYAVSPYGDITRMNPMWWASDDGAALVAKKLSGVAVLRDSTPQTGPPLARWHVAHVQDRYVPPMGRQISDNRVLMMVLDLPVAKMWAVQMPRGCEINAGYLEDGLRRNFGAPDQGEGYLRRMAGAECPGSVMSTLRFPFRLARKVLRIRAYPPLTVGGAPLKMHPPRRKGL